MQYIIHHSNKQQLYPKCTTSTRQELFLSSLLRKIFFLRILTQIQLTRISLSQILFKIQQKDALFVSLLDLLRF